MTDFEIQMQIDFEMLRQANNKNLMSDDEFAYRLLRYKNNGAGPVVQCRNDKIRWAMITHSDKNIYTVLRGYFSGEKLNDAGKNLLALSYIVLDGYRYQIAKRDEKEVELNAELFSAGR